MMEWTSGMTIDVMSSTFVAKRDEQRIPVAARIYVQM